LVFIERIAVLTLMWGRDDDVPASTLTPTMIPALLGHKAAFVAAGWKTSFAATDSGVVSAWGCAPKQGNPAWHLGFVYGLRVGSISLL